DRSMLESAGALDTLAAEGGLALERIRLTDDLRHSERRFRSLVLHASDVITAVDANFAISYQSPSIERLLQRTPESLVGVELELLLHPDDVEDVLAALDAAHQPQVARVEARLRRSDGSYVQCEVVANNMLADPDVRMSVLNIRDISERKAFEEQLAHRAFHDALTGLPNRALFSEHAQQARARAQRGGPPMAVLMLDLDDFKRVNDTLGHSAGDRLLVSLAERLRRCVRPSDTVARLGGDEFALIIVAGPEQARRVAARVLDEMSQPVEIGDEMVAVGASVGIAMSESGEESLEELLRMADFAMYSAKSGGKSRAALYEPRMHSEVLGVR
ncbi:MAG TPA: sensor domain-containing diguanylate cyclase, partial [Egibacteraceae bacterium]|nr:sensor domain-containing diguanylate cyclase [Egibacteraceae bacterium]